jgi:hypothetical protein
MGQALGDQVVGYPGTYPGKNRQNTSTAIFAWQNTIKSVVDSRNWSLAVPTSVTIAGSIEKWRNASTIAKLLPGRHGG